MLTSAFNNEFDEGLIFRSGLVETGFRETSSKSDVEAGVLGWVSWRGRARVSRTFRVV